MSVRMITSHVRNYNVCRHVQFFSNPEMLICLPLPNANVVPILTVCQKKLSADSFAQEIGILWLKCTELLVMSSGKFSTVGGSEFYAVVRRPWNSLPDDDASVGHSLHFSVKKHFLTFCSGYFKCSFLSMERTQH